MRRGIDLAGHVIFNGADQRAPASGSGEDRFDEKSACTLSIGSCNARDRNTLGRPLVEVRAYSRQCPAPVGEDGPSDTLARFLGCRIGHDGDRTGPNSLLDKAVAV